MAFSEVLNFAAALLDATANGNAFKRHSGAVCCCYNNTMHFFWKALWSELFGAAVNGYRLVLCPQLDTFVYYIHLLLIIRCLLTILI